MNKHSFPKTEHEVRLCEICKVTPIEWRQTTEGRTECRKQWLTRKYCGFKEGECYAVLTFWKLWEKKYDLMAKEIMAKNAESAERNFLYPHRMTRGAIYDIGWDK